MEYGAAENTGPLKEAEAVGQMLADAFIARVMRYPTATRRHLLLACRQRLLQEFEIAELLFEGD